MVGHGLHGHRTRLRERFGRGGIASFHDHEILEFLLTFVLPRSDTKPIAKRLLARFGSVSAVLGADTEQLTAVSGIGDRAAMLITLVRELAAYSLRERVHERCAFSSRRDVEEYLRLAFGGRRDEYVAVLFLDTANRILSAEVIAEGTVNQCVIYPREVIRKALAAGSSGIILAHNHPAGTPHPSEADWALTNKLYEIGRLLDIPLLDHLIVCRDQVQGLREMPRWPR